jgi:cation transport ATPase
MIAHCAKHAWCRSWKDTSSGEICEVPIAAVEAGDIVLLRPGERSAVDGSVIEGQSKIDQPLLGIKVAPPLVQTRPAWIARPKR